MAISPVHHVALSVTDLDRSVAFYRDVLGLRKTIDSPLEGPPAEKLLALKPGSKGRTIIMQAGKAITGEVELISFGPPSERVTDPKRPGDPGVFLISFQVTGEDLHAVYERMRRQGVRCLSEPQSLVMKGYGTIRAFVIEDPDGVLIELIELPSLEEARRAYRAGAAKS